MADLYFTHRLSWKKYFLYFLYVFALNFFFFFLIGEKGSLWGKDTIHYILWSNLPIKGGYVIYPWFLKGLRFIHGEKLYFEYAYIYQSILSIAVDILLIEYIRTKYRMGHLAGMVMHILILATYSYTLPGAVSSHYLLTEGITIPIFLLSMYFYLRYLNGESYIYLLTSCVVCIVLYFTRQQLIVILLVYLGIAAMNEILERIGPKHSLRIYLLSLCIILVMAVACIYGYFRYVSGWEYSEENNQLIEATTGKALCLMTEEDSMLYTGQDREIYNELYQDCKTNGRLLENFPHSIMDYEEIHKIINENITEHETIIWEYFYRLQSDNGGLDAYAVRNRITATETSNHRAEYLGLILRLMPSSLVASIFVQPSKWRLLCYIFSILMYLVTVIIIIYSIKQRQIKAYYLPEVIVLSIIFCNSIFCNILLYGQQRYVIYCMGLFYVFNIIMINGLRKDKYEIQDDRKH